MTIAESPTLGRSRLSFAKAGDLEEFVATLGRFERGEMSADAWRLFRLVRGTYGQRQDGDLHMLRVKIPQGVLDGPQLRALADVADTWSRGFGHITTRQNVQLHFLKLHDVEPAMERLAAAGLTTREACGNSVRNVTTCAYAGVAGDEVFDVTPYAEALTRHFLRHPLSSSLPRKFKVAFEGCGDDHCVTAINDLGWRARLQGGRRGFRVAVGGGTATLASSARVLFDFLPAGAILELAEAVIRLFHRLGDRKNKHKNRLKFLIRQLGWEGWVARLQQSLAEVRAEGGIALPFDPEAPPVEAAPDWRRPPAPSIEESAARAKSAQLRGPGIAPAGEKLLQVRDDALARWLSTNVRGQKQAGYCLAEVTLPLGDFTGAQARLLADLALAYGDGSVRVTTDQDLVFRWIREQDLAPLYRRLAAAGLGEADAHTIADVTSCPGAESCKLAVTHSRGLGQALGEHLRARPDLVQAAPDLRLRISGCPNGCGQHHIAGIGFQGSVRKLGERAVPQYFVMVGGGVGPEGASFARLAAKIPARRLPQAVERIVDLYRSEGKDGETATAFLQRVDLALVKQVLAGLEELTAERSSPEDFIDLGEQTEFKPETQAGECAA